MILFYYEKILSANIILIKQMADTENIPNTITVKTDPSIEAFKSLTASTQILFVDAAFDKHVLLPDENIALQDVLDNAGCPAELILAK